jgi:hypothetical protein
LLAGCIKPSGIVVERIEESAAEKMKAMEVRLNIILALPLRTLQPAPLSNSRLEMRRLDGCVLTGALERSFHLVAIRIHW